MNVTYFQRTIENEAGNFQKEGKSNYDDIFFPLYN